MPRRSAPGPARATDTFAPAVDPATKGVSTPLVTVTGRLLDPAGRFVWEEATNAGFAGEGRRYDLKPRGDDRGPEADAEARPPRVQVKAAGGAVKLVDEAGNLVAEVVVCYRSGKYVMEGDWPSDEEIERRLREDRRYTVEEVRERIRKLRKAHG